MNIQLSDHFTMKRLIRFVIPSIIMMIFTSIYGVVDGFFVSNFVGKTPFAAVNLIMPVPMMLGALGFMLGTGGTALVSMTLGEGKKELANKIFSFLIYVGIIIGCILTVLGIIIIEPVAVLLGAKGEMISMCVIYARILLIALPAFIMQNMFQSFLVAAEKPMFGLGITLIAGIINMVLDGLFMAVFKWGIAGAAFATAISQFVGGIIPFVYFIRKNNSPLQLVKPKFDGNALFKACTNGSSLFTALNNGIISAMISFLRTIVFQVAAIMIMPGIWGLDGIWYSVVTAEALATLVSLFFIVKYKKRYHY